MTKGPVVVPITRSREFAQTTGIIRCDPPRAIDLRARRGRRLEQVPDEVMEEVLARLAPVFE